MVLVLVVYIDHVGVIDDDDNDNDDDVVEDNNNDAGNDDDDDNDKNYGDDNFNDDGDDCSHWWCGWCADCWENLPPLCDPHFALRSGGSRPLKTAYVNKKCANNDNFQQGRHRWQ